MITQSRKKKKGLGLSLNWQTNHPLLQYWEKGEENVGKSIEDKSSQKEYIVQRVDMLLNVLDTIDAETAGVEEIDRIIGMLDDLEFKCKQFRNQWEKEEKQS